MCIYIYRYICIYQNTYSPKKTCKHSPELRPLHFPCRLARFLAFSLASGVEISASTLAATNSAGSNFSSSSYLAESALRRRRAPLAASQKRRKGGRAGGSTRPASPVVWCVGGVVVWWFGGLVVKRRGFPYLPSTRTTITTDWRLPGYGLRVSASL